MKKIMAWIILGGVAIMVPLLAKKLGNLPEVSNFASIHVYNNRLFVLDHKVHIDLYSLKPFRYIKQVSRHGIGPSECTGLPIVIVYSDYLYLYNRGRCIFFTHDGDYIKEFKIPRPHLSIFAPIGKNFISNITTRDGNTQCMDTSICSYTEKEGIKHKKVAYILINKTLEQKGNRVANNPFQNMWHYRIYDDKLFIGDPSRGFFAEIYNSEGNRISQIRLNYEKVKIPEENKERVRKIYESSSKWKAYEDMYFWDIPGYYPYFHNFFVGKNKLYFVTYKTQGNKREIIVTDWKGKLLKKAYVQVLVPWEHYICAIANDKLYYILDNEESEDWELHVEDIK